MTELPGGWETKRLDEIADIVMGQSPPGSSYNEHGEGKPFFQGKTEFGEVNPTVRKYTTAGTKFAKNGDILMSVRAPVGPTNIANIDCVIGRGLAAIRAKNLVSQDYLRWSLKHLEMDIQSKGTGTTFDAITGETLRGTLVALPPIEEQDKIVKLLENHLSRLDAASADVSQGLNKIRQFRRSFLQNTFIQDKNTSLCTLGEVVEVKTGKIDANRAEVDGKYPFFTCAREISRINDAPFEGKVVLVAGNGDLNVKYYEGRFNAYQRTYILKSKNEETLFPKYLFWFMEHYIFELRTLAIGTTIKYIKLGNLVDAKMSLPSIDIQKQIVLDIEKSLSFIDKSEETFSKLKKESQSLRRALLKWAFSGNLTNEVLHV